MKMSGRTPNHLVVVVIGVGQEGGMNLCNNTWAWNQMKTVSMSWSGEGGNYITTYSHSPAMVATSMTGVVDELVVDYSMCC